MPRHARHWHAHPATSVSSVTLRRLRVPVTAGLAALLLGAAIPLAGPRSPVPPIVGEPVAGAALPSPVVAPAPAPPAALIDPGPDDRRSVRAAPTPAAPATLGGYVWPLPRGRLTLPFGPSRWGSRVVDRQRFHDGIDLATFCGDRVVAAHDGIVLAAGRRYDRWMGWRGDLSAYNARLEEKRAWSTLPIVVVIDDGNGYRSVYAHFSKVVVRRGQPVQAGQLIGYEGQTGRASGCHLHYGLFSPFERSTFAIHPTVVKRMLVPARQTARIDPLLVLPDRPDPAAKPPVPEPFDPVRPAAYRWE